jgi:hypothetical protein
MASLYKRASERQRRILRMVEGAVKNAADHHPDMTYSPRMARSIAKRAAGTISAAWPGLLAVEAIPVSKASGQVVPAGHLGSQFVTAHGMGEPDTLASGPSRGRAQVSKPGRTLDSIWAKVAVLAGQAKRAGQTERAAALVEVLKIIAAEQP